MDEYQQVKLEISHTVILPPTVSVPSGPRFKSHAHFIRFSIYCLLYFICHCIEKRIKINQTRPGSARLKNNLKTISFATNLQVFRQPSCSVSFVVGEEEPVAVFQDPELLSDEEGERGAERRA